MVLPLLNRFLHWMVVGIITPVLALLILSKGVSLAEVGLVIALSSACVVVFEIPSGVLSDRWGRKAVYLLSLAISFSALAVMFLGRGPAWMAAGFALYGVARAFSSGSIESDFIDRHIETRGEDSLHSLIAGMNAAEALGLAGGAALGGAIPLVWARLAPGANPYGGNLLVQAAIIAALFALTLATHSSTGKGNGGTLTGFAAEVGSTLGSTPGLLPLMLGSAVWGFSLFAVETYWQPRMRDILGSSEQSWIFGFVGAGYFAFALAGTVVAGWRGKIFHKSPFLWLAAFRLLLGGSIAALAAQGSLAGFLVPFFLIMAMNGMAGVPESTALNRLIGGKNRATILSIGSFAMQLGGIVGAASFSFLLRSRGIPSAWIVSGAVFALSGGIYLAAHRRNPGPSADEASAEING